MAAFCRLCGDAIPAGSRVCPGCGSAIRPPLAGSHARIVLLVALVAAVLIGGGTALALSSSGPNPTTDNPTAGQTPTTTAARVAGAGRTVAPTTVAKRAKALSTTKSAPDPTSTTVAAQTEQAAAGAVNSIVAQSETARADVDNAYSEVAGCADVAGGVASFQADAATRAELVSQLARVDRQAMPSGAQMVASLTEALQASISSDDDYAMWGQDVEQDDGCAGASAAPEDDQYFEAAQQSDVTATMAKQAFASEWAPIAQQFSLPVPTATQI